MRGVRRSEAAICGVAGVAWFAAPSIPGRLIEGHLEVFFGCSGIALATTGGSCHGNGPSCSKLSDGHTIGRREALRLYRHSAAGQCGQNRFGCKLSERLKRWCPVVVFCLVARGAFARKQLASDVACR